MVMFQCGFELSLGVGVLVKFILMLVFVTLKKFRSSNCVIVTALA